MLEDYVKLELKKKERIVSESENFITVVTFCTVWPFETMIVSKKPLQYLLKFDEEFGGDIAESIKTLSGKYEAVFNISFTYTAGIHQAPIDGMDYPEWHFHMHFYPPLLRSTAIKKFMVGYEMLGNPQMDIPSETSSEILKKSFLQSSRYEVKYDNKIKYIF